MSDAPSERSHLKTASINGAAVSFAAQMMKFGLTFLNQVLLARLLMPEDFGLLAMAWPVIAFIQLFADLGLSQATIQRKEINQGQLSFLFWLNVSASGFLAALVIVLSPLVAMFYHEPRVAGVVAALGAMFLVNGLSTQHFAIFTRHLQFRKLALIDLTAFFVSMAVGLTAAWSGMGYWSLVVSQASNYLASSSLAWLLSQWRPSRPAFPDEWRDMLKFGGNLTGFNLVNYFARNLDNVLIGRYNGEAALGLYDRAYKLLLLPLNQINQPVSRVAMPLLARTQGEPEVYRRAYLRMIEMVMLMIYPGVIFAIVTSHNLITTVLGERWAEVGPIFAVLGIGALFAPLGQSTGWLFISQGRTREMRNWGIVCSAIYVASFVAGLPWGPLGVAIAYITTGCFLGPMLWWAVTRSGPVRLRDILGVVFPYAVSGLASAAVVYIVNREFATGFLLLGGELVCSYAVFLTIMFIQPRGRKILMELYRHVWTTLKPVIGRFRAPTVTS